MFVQGIGEYLFLHIIEDIEIIVKIFRIYWKKSHSFQALKMLPRENIQVATKFGFAELGLDAVIVKGNPEYVRSCCEASLKRLDVEYIDLYYQHRVDTSVPIEETVSDSFFLRLTI